MIRTIVFDLGKVILGFDHELISRRFARAAGLAEAQVNALFSATPLERQFELGDISAEDFYAQACALLKIQVPYPVFTAWWSDIFTPVPGMQELVQRLKMTSCRLALLSNTNELHFSYIQQQYPELIALFDDLFLSYRLHCRKPDSDAFHAVIHASGCPAGEIAFIDDIEAHVAAARRAGLSSVRFISSAQAELFLRSLGVPV